MDAVFSDVIAALCSPFAGHVHSRRLRFDDGASSGPHVYFADLVGQSQDAREGGDFSKNVHDSFEFEDGVYFFFDAHSRGIAEEAFSVSQKAWDEVGKFVITAFVNDDFVCVPCDIDGRVFHAEGVDEVVAEVGCMARED